MTATVSPIREFTDEEALASLDGRSPGNLSDLGRQWGWPRARVRRRVDAWRKSGQVAGHKNRPRGRPATRPDTPAKALGRPAMRATAGRLHWSAWPLIATTIGLMAVSLSHLAGGIEQLTEIPTWQAWAMSFGIDAMLISVALAQLTAAADVKKDIGTVAHLMEVVTLVMSAGLNALAFTGGAFDLAHWPQVLFGCFVPGAISGATFILARMTKV